MRGGEMYMANMFKGIRTKAQHTTEPSKPLFSNGTKKRLKRTMVFIAFLVVIGVLFALFMLVSNFFDKHAFRFQAPILMRSPVLIYDRENIIEQEVAARVKKLLPKPTKKPSPTAEPTYRYLNFNLVPKAYAEGKFATSPSHTGEAEIINSQKHAKIIWRIYMLESTFGRQDDCVQRGLVNGFGYGINTSEHRCYRSFADVVSDVNTWLDTYYQEGWDLGTMLCYYNKGLQISDCNYMQKFLSII